MRVTPGVEADTHEYIRTGMEDSKFGFTMRDDFAFKCVADVLATPGVRLAGLHCHIGSGIFALHSFREAVQVMIDLIARIKAEYGLELRELDLGGGLGIAYSADDEPATIEAMRQYIGENGYAEDLSNARLHHEIYLSDPRKAPPEKWRTVIRHPVRRI
jgi:diaminopimelate decarboxylase